MKLNSIDIDVIVADIETCQGQIKRLQHSTIECVSIGATGKLTVTDKGKLEELNAEIDRLTTLAGHNEAVLSRLNDCLASVGCGSVGGLEKAIRTSDEKIVSCKTGISRIQADYLRANPYQYTLETIGQHPKVKREVEAREQTIAAETEKLNALRPALDEAVAIAAEFQPSGLQPMPARTTPIALTREKLGGLI